MFRFLKYKIRTIRSLIIISMFVIGLAANAAMPALASGSGTFQKTGSMNVARIYYSATLLANGEVLVAGGENSTVTNSPLASAELYNPATGAWTFTGNMTVPRLGPLAVLLQNGQVLVAGGSNGSSTLTSAELYNPSTGAWTATGSLLTAGGGSLTLLPNGQVLAVQGSSAELYNPAAGTWSATGSPTSGVGGSNAPLLQNGEVWAIGQSANTPSELYNPSTGAWSASGSAPDSLLNPVIPLLLNGEVFATGSSGSGLASYSFADLYDPSTGQFTSEVGPCNCRDFSTSGLQTGKVLVAGGAVTMAANPYPHTLTINSAELWDPSTQAWTSTGNLHDSRINATMTVLQNGQVLVAGGEQSTKQTNYQFVLLSSAELYTP